MKVGLTRRQHECLTFIGEYTDAHGYSPSYDEIKEALGLSNKSGVHRLVHGLHRRGFLALFNGQARSIVVLADLPRIQKPLTQAWNAASPSERQDFLFLIGARLENEVSA